MQKKKKKKLCTVNEPYFAYAKKKKKKKKAADQLCSINREVMEVEIPETKTSQNIRKTVHKIYTPLSLKPD